MPIALDLIMESCSRGGMRVRWTVSWAAAGCISFLLNVSSLVGVVRADGGSDYGNALELSLLFFEAQRSGYLPANNRVTWRSNSGLHDGESQGVDLTGGYYDAGDNVKFGLPMAFTITTLSWSVIAYGSQLQEQGQLQAALDSVKWGTDYFIKAHPEPDVLWAEVGDGDTDHYCWERPEDMTTSRQAYRIDSSNPGSEVAGETAAAMAAASIVFSSSNPAYSATLLEHARQLFSLADTYRGRYDAAIPVVKSYYPSGPSGYNDELLWAALWLFEATDDQYYLKYAIDNAQVLGGTGWAMTQFGWDVKYSGLQLLAAKVLLEGRGGAYTSTLQAYKKQADFFMCAALTKNNNGQQLARSPGGMFWTQSWNNMQFVTSGAFLLTLYADILAENNGQLYCSGSLVQPSELLNAGKQQVDYILGNNPRGRSYMVGYSQNYPQFVHHRGASIPSIKVDAEAVGCREGYSVWYGRQQPNPNVLVGAVVGGPDQNDNYVDRRDNWEGSEACVYNNAPLVGLLARWSAGGQASPYYSFTGTTSTTPAALSDSETISPAASPRVSQAELAALLKLTQQLIFSWEFHGVAYYKYQGALINDSDRSLEDFIMSFEVLDGPVYGLRQIGNTGSTVSLFTFPTTQKSLKPGKSLKFVYISRHSKPCAASLHLEKFS